MTDRSVQAEDEANAERSVRRDHSGKKPSIVDVAEDAVGFFAKPLMRERLTPEEREERREENDADSRRGE